MTQQQAENVKRDFGGAPLSALTRMMDFYRQEDIEDMARYYGVKPTKESVIAYLMR